MDDLVFWVFFLLALMPFAVASGWLLGGVRRSRRRRPLPGLWWVCASCRSVNAPDAPACYACGTPLPPDPTTLPTAPDFNVVQRFGPLRPVDELTSGRPPARPLAPAGPAPGHDPS